MVIKNLMQKQLITCSPSTTVQNVAGLMKKHNIGCVLIVEDGSKLTGIITDRDIVLHLAADSKNPQSTPVRDIMTSNPETINSDADIDSALQVMSKGNIRRLPVTEDGRLVGLLSSADLAVELKQEFDQFISLEEVIAK